MKSFIERIKDTKKIASEKNIHSWHNCIFHSVLIIMAISMVLSLNTMIHLLNISGDTPINELPTLAIGLPIIYGLILSYFFLDKLIVLNILFFSHVNKQVFKLWQKLDMYWFKKYRKHSPLTEGLSKFQSKITSKSKKQRKLIALGIIIALIIFQVGIRVPSLMDSFEQQEEIKQELELIDETIESQRPEIIVKGVG